MILVGSQRGGAGNLAAHLLNDRDNDHVELLEVRGFVSEDLEGALAEAHAVSMATQCRQFMFSLSLNPPKGAVCSIEEMVEAANKAEAVLGLQGQQRAIVVHEKEGRRHIHVVWSRIDIAEMKAVALPFYKNRLAALSKELYLVHGWDLPDGHKENGWKNPLNFTLADWQQAKRLGLDPREVRLLFADAWQHSDGLKSFMAALEHRGYFLAAGDRRGFVAVDLQGEVFSVSRMVGIRTKDLETRLGSPDVLPRVDEVRKQIDVRMRTELRDLLSEERQRHHEALAPLLEERRRVLDVQRRERERLRVLQVEREKRERNERQQQFRRGIRGLWDVLTGRAAALRRDHERAAFENYVRDRDQSEALVELQAKERAELQASLDDLRRTQRHSLMHAVQQVARLIRGERAHDRRSPEPSKGTLEWTPMGTRLRSRGHDRER